MFQLIYPGQGSQHPGMGRFLFDNFPVAKQTFEEASDAISLDLKKLCFEGSEADLALTENTQPAILTVSTATQRVLRTQLDLKISSAAGHSIGEYAALVSANVLDFGKAVKAVKIRGQAMQSAVPVGLGGMVATMGLDPEQARKVCEYVVQKSGFSPLSPANFNCPGQIVLSGSQKAISWMKDNLKIEEVLPEAKRVKFIPLQVSAPFHCEMMMPAEEKMRQVLSEITFQEAHFPIIQNFTAKTHTKAAELKENLIRQVSAPVLWMQSMDLAKSQGWNKCIECGAGKVLQGLLKKIDSEAFQVFNTTTLEDIENIEKFVKLTH